MAKLPIEYYDKMLEKLAKERNMPNKYIVLFRADSEERHILTSDLESAEFIASLYPDSEIYELGKCIRGNAVEFFIP